MYIATFWGKSKIKKSKKQKIKFLKILTKHIKMPPPWCVCEAYQLSDWRLRSELQYCEEEVKRQSVQLLQLAGPTAQAYA